MHRGFDGALFGFRLGSDGIAGIGYRIIGYWIFCSLYFYVVFYLRLVSLFMACCVYLLNLLLFYCNCDSLDVASPIVRKLYSPSKYILTAFLYLNYFPYFLSTELIPSIFPSLSHPFPSCSSSLPFLTICPAYFQF